MIGVFLSLRRAGEDSDQGYYDKPVNVYRAYLESIIAALSVTVPPITCYPDDADNPLDVTTAKAGDKIAELIFKHNDAPLFWLHALFVFCTEGMTACYTYPNADEKYGTYKEKKYEELPKNIMNYISVHSVRLRWRDKNYHSNSRKISFSRMMKMRRSMR